MEYARKNSYVTKEQFTRLLDSSTDLVVLQDTEQRVLWANARAAHLDNEKIDDIVGQPCYTIWGTGHPCKGCPVKQALADGHCHEYERRDHLGRGWNIRAFPIAEHNGAITGIVEVARDITARMNAEDELRAAEAMYSRQTEAILGLTVPVVGHWEGIFLLPVVGMLGTNRSRGLMEQLVTSAVQDGAEVVIIDLSSEPLPDDTGIQHVVSTALTAKMLDASVVLTGYTPETMQKLVPPSVDLSAFHMEQSLRDGIATALDLVGTNSASDFLTPVSAH